MSDHRAPGVGNRVLAEPVSPSRAAQVQRSVVSGLPVLWCESPGPFTVGLTFRVGRADEDAPRNGITHLVEHLALPTQRVGRIDFNGTVWSSLTAFWASGDRDAALDLVRGVVATLSSLPHRLDTERGILLAEASSRGVGWHEVAAALRFGPRGHGLAGYDELGLRWLGHDEASAWARERFTLGNAALWLTGEPPDELGLELPPGDRVAAPEPRPIPDVPFPAAYRHVRGGGAAISLLVPRTTAASLAAYVAAERARARLRYEGGLSYGVEWHWEPLTGSTASGLLWCDCRPGDERQAARLLRETLETLAEHGPTEEELELEVDDRRRRLADESGANGRLFSAVSDELLRDELRQPHELLEEAEAVTRPEAAEALREMLGTALLLADDLGFRPDGTWSSYPLYSDEVVRGRVHNRPLARLVRFGRKQVQLVAGEEGLSYLRGGRDATTIRYADCEAAERWPDGTLLLYGADASRLVVNPAEWTKGRRLVAEIEGRVPDGHVVPMNPAVEARLAELGDGLRGRSGRRDREQLQRAAAFLDFGEAPLGMLSAKVSDKPGVLLLTPRRLLFVSYGDALVELPLHAVRFAQPRRTDLNSWTVYVRTDEQTYAFAATGARRRLDTFLSALRDAGDAPDARFEVREPPTLLERWLAPLSLIALPLSVLPLFPLAELEDLDSHARILLVSALVAVVCGGICAAGAWLGVVARRRARAGGVRSLAALSGIALGVLGALVWVAMAVAIPFAEW